jgi:predicted amidohydrolase YtcJ
MTSLPLPRDPRDAGSEGLAALVADVLAGRATLEKGGPADMSVLSDDPSLPDPAKRATIRVVEEVRKGRTVWRRDPTRR